MLKSLIGLDNGFLKVISFNGMSNKNKDGKRKRLWNVLCRCSNMCIISTSQFNINQPKSCGCYKQKRRGNKNFHKYHTKHGLANKHPLYKTWKNMKQRCYNPNNKDYRFYGKKGIEVCIEWKTCAKTFIEWALSNSWKKFLVIDRINPNNHYSPNNCRFITASENSKRVISPKGSNRKQAILNEEQVREIKKRISIGDRSYLIAMDYGINQNIIYQIKSNKTWKHVSLI